MCVIFDLRNIEENTQDRKWEIILEFIFGDTMASKIARSQASLLARAKKVFPGGKYTRKPMQELRYGPPFIESAMGCSVVGTDSKK